MTPELLYFSSTAVALVMKRGKTIQVFLTDGTPRGIKVADITSNIEQALFIPTIVTL